MAGRRRSPWGILAAFAAGIAVAATIGAVAGRDDEADDASANEVELSAIAVETRTMRTFVTYLGSLQVGTTEPLVARRGGTVTAATESGTVLEAGDELMRIDDEPVVIMYCDVPMYRALEDGDEGADVTQLETFLALGGYDTDDPLTIDEEFTSATSDALENWQESIDLDTTGELEAGRFTVVGGPVEVIDMMSVGELVRDGATVATVAADETVTVSITDGDARPLAARTDPAKPTIELSVVPDEIDNFVAGQAVEVEAADELTYDGVVAEVGTIAVVDPLSPEAPPGVPVTVELEAGTDVLAGPAEVRVVEEEQIDVVAVPTRALLALAEGGQAVEVVDADGGSRLVGVELGIYADGWVEVISDTEGGAIKAGTEVAVPT